MITAPGLRPKISRIVRQTAIRAGRRHVAIAVGARVPVRKLVEDRITLVAIRVCLVKVVRRRRVVIRAILKQTTPVVADSTRLRFADWLCGYALFRRL